MEKEIVKTEKDLVSLGIEELESRQEMALMATELVDVEANSKCSENQSCNTAAGCGVEA